MSYRTCYLCKHWSENTQFCLLHNKSRSESDFCSSIQLIPCCGSCKHWSRDYDSMDEGVCDIYQGLSSAASICNAGYYTEK